MTGSEAFQAGRSAFAAGVKVGDNPWHESDARHWDWLQGWTAAGMDKIRNKGNQ